MLNFRGMPHTAHPFSTFSPSSIVFRLLSTILNAGHAIPEDARRTASALSQEIVLAIAAARAAEDRGADGAALLAARLGLPFRRSSAPAVAGTLADHDAQDDGGSLLAGAACVSDVVARLKLPSLPLPWPPSDPGVGGWGFHPLVPCVTDPPSNVFRLRMVTVLLETCGAFFCKGAAAERLDRFLVYLQRYAFSKVCVCVSVCGDS